MAEYDTGLDEIPPPITDFAKGPGDAGGRSASSTTEDRLVEAGILSWNIGLETVTRGAWKRHHWEVSHTPLFEYLLADSTRAHLAFYRREFGYEDVDAFLAAADDNGLMDCPENVVETWIWIRDLDHPTSPEDVRRRSAFRDSQSATSDRRVATDTPDIDDTEQGTLTSF